VVFIIVCVNIQYPWWQAICARAQRLVLRGRIVNRFRHKRSVSIRLRIERCSRKIAFLSELEDR